MKRVLFVILLITTCCVLAMPALADPPANDDCENATIVGDGILQLNSSMQFVGTNVDATADCEANDYSEVWLEFTIEVSMDLTVSYEGTYPPFDDGEFVSRYLFDSCPCGESYQYSISHMYEDWNTGRTWVGLPAGTYYFPVLMHSSFASGDYLVTVFGSEFVPAENDDCENATIVDDGIIEAGETMTFTGDNSGTTIDCENNANPEAWIKFTTIEEMNVIVDYCGTSPAFTSFYAYLYDSCPCGTSINADGLDYCESDYNRKIVWNNLPAGTYWFPVRSYGSSVGEYIINVTAIPNSGACCYESGESIECITTDETSCNNSYGGTWMGFGTNCGEYDEETGWSGCQGQITGACCYENGESTECIENVTETYCNQILIGDWKGAGSSCGEYDEESGWSGCNVQIGACCYNNGQDCIVTNQAVCIETYEGTWMGAGTDCTDNDENGTADVCDESSTGACCYNDSYSCVETDEMTCLEQHEGTWMGLGSECGYIDSETGGYMGCPQPPTGACCFERSGETRCAAYVTSVYCDEVLRGTWMGEGTDCTDSDENGIADVCEVPTTGACCYEEYENTYCFVIDEENCYNFYNGEWMGAGTDCTDSDENEIADVCEAPDAYEYLPGDANMSTGNWPPSTIGGDVTYLVNYFRGITAPCMLDGFYASADANGSCSVTGADVTKLVSYFRGMDDLNYCPDYPTTWPPIPDTAPDGWPNCASPVLSK